MFVERDACSRGIQVRASDELSQDFEHACDDCHCYENGTAQISLIHSLPVIGKWDQEGVMEASAVQSCCGPRSC